jgi:hypothetical protein
MIRLLLPSALRSPAERRILPLACVGRLERLPLRFQPSNPTSVSFSSSSIVPTTRTRYRIGSPFETPQNGMKTVIHRSISFSRGPRVTGKAVIQYRDPSDEYGPRSHRDRRFQERNADGAPEEEKPSINLKGWDIHSYRGWDAVDDTEVTIPPPRVN